MRLRRKRRAQHNPIDPEDDYLPLGSITHSPVDFNTYRSAVPVNTAGDQGNPYMLAAATLVGSGGAYDSPQVMPWQAEVWDYFENIPQLAWAARRMSNAMSRIELFVGIKDTTDGIPDRIPADTGDDAQGTDETRAADRRVLEPLAELFGGEHGGMLARIGGHLTAVGDSYICGFSDPATQQPGWYVASHSELAPVQGGAELTRDGMGNRIPIRAGKPGDPVDRQTGMVIRLWRPHLRYGWQADAPTRSLRGTFKQISGSDAHIESSLESRLAGNGILFIPQSTTVPGNPGQKRSHTDPTTAAIIDAAITPLKNRRSASARVPLVARVSDEAIGKIQHVSFSTPLDASILPLRESALQTLATSMDQPAEVMTGLGQGNHWNAWAITEDEIKMTIAPMCEVICAAITEKYLWPRLQRMQVKDYRRYVIYFDVSQLAQRPNRAPDAQTLHASGLVSDATTRRESGFTEDDAPGKEEEFRNLLLRLMVGGVPIELARPYLVIMGYEVPEAQTAPTPGVADGVTGQPEDARGGGAAGDPADPGNGTPDNAGPPNTPGSPSNAAPPAVAAPAAPAAIAASALTLAASAGPVEYLQLVRANSGRPA